MPLECLKGEEVRLFLAYANVGDCSLPPNCTLKIVKGPSLTMKYEQCPIETEIDGILLFDLTITAPEEIGTYEWSI